MRRARLAQLLLLLLLLSFSVPLAHAQGVRAFVMAGGSFLENNRLFSKPIDERFQSSYASGGRITFGGELTFSRILGFEGSYGYGRNNLRVANLVVPATSGYGVRSQRFSVNAVGHSPVAFLGLRPYVTAGLEYDHLAPTSQAKAVAFTQGFAGQQVVLGNNNKIGVNYGGGAEWGFLPTIALRLDLRDHITGSPTYGLSGSKYPISGSAHDVELSVGLSFHVGK